MPSLVIPEDGLSFEGPRYSKPASTMPTAFGLTLADGVIEEMIKCVEKGQSIQLSLGDRPILSYGATTQPLYTSANSFTHELYRSSSNSNPNSETESSPNSSNMPPLRPEPKRSGMEGLTSQQQLYALFGIKYSTVKPTDPPASRATSKASSVPTSKNLSHTAEADPALAQLKSSMASENAKKAGNSTKYIKDLPLPGQWMGIPAKAGYKAKYPASNNHITHDTPRSTANRSNMSSGVGSSHGSVPLSQKQAEQAKATRKPVVHLLALSPMTDNELKIKIVDASHSDIKQALQKVGNLNTNSRKWELSSKYYKELDIWLFKYDSEQDRQRAIDNAVRHFDKMRLGVSEPEWDRLLPLEERGTGKCLSKLQAQIAHGPVARTPKINVQKAQDSGNDTPAGGDDEDEGAFGHKNTTKANGESKSRGVQPPPAKSKKAGDKESQAKGLLSKNLKPKPKPAPKKAAAQKAGSKVLSSQFVSDSDEEEDDYMIVTKTKSTQGGNTKRSREDEPESSDSSEPLSKKVKKTTTNHRVSDTSQSSRTTTTSTYSSSSSKTKNNSPQKSSPLASSPPTNASEVENSSGHTSSYASGSPMHTSITVSRSSIHKRHQKSSSVASSVSSTTSTRSLKPEVMDLARRYKSYYPKYEALHKEVASFGMDGRRDTDKEQKLLDMHERLSQMKKEILAGIVEGH